MSDEPEIDTLKTRIVKLKEALQDIKVNTDSVETFMKVTETLEEDDKYENSIT